MRKSAILLFYLIIVLQSVSFCQKKNKKKAESDTVTQTSFISQPERIEFEIEGRDENFTIVSAEEDGLLVIKETRNRAEKGYLWEFYLIDSTLNVVWSSMISVDYGALFLGYDYSENGFYVLFRKNDYKKEEMKLFTLDLATGDALSYDLTLALPLDLSHFEVVGNSLIFGGISNFKPVITLIDLDDVKPVIMAGIYNNNSSILDIRINDEYNNFTVVMNERLMNKQFTISLKTFTEKGQSVHSTSLKTELDKSLLDGVSTHFDNGTQYIAGTYAKKKSEYSMGLYIAQLSLGDQKFIKYHNYADLDNFFSYMSAKRENRVKERIERKSVKGKKAKFNYRLLVNDIIQRDGEYILIGEAYYPKYASGYTSNMGYGSSLANPAFLGYKFTHAVVVGFSKNGDVLWDNSFEINDVLTYSLEGKVKVNVENDRVVLLYIYDGVIRSKIIKGNDIIEGKSFDPIALHFLSDEIRGNEKELEGLQKWYGANFYTYGIQNIKNLKDQNVKLNRRVFYINKVQYE